MINAYFSFLSSLESSNLTDEQIESYMQFVDSELGSVSGAHRVELLEELRGSTVRQLFELFNLFTIVYFIYLFYV